MESHNTNFDNGDAKEVYYHVCQAFDVGFNSRNVNLTYEQFLIFNMDYENEVGEHWVAIYIDGKMRSAYIFDSLPVRTFPQNIIKKLSKICDKIYDLIPQCYILQRPDFPLCRIYCLVFLECYSKNQPFLLCPENRLLNDFMILKHMLPYIVSAVDFFA